METSRAKALMAQALDYRSLRQDMISGNIANVDTPFYRPRDIEFESVLAEKSSKIFNATHEKTLSLAQTSPNHLGPMKDTNGKANIFFRDGHLARNDGNSVDLDVESTELAKNSVMYDALINAIKQDSMMFKAAIDSSSKL